MKTFEYLSDLADYNSFLAEHISKHIDRSDRDESFSWVLGGDVYIISTVEEYRKVIAENQFFDIAEDINDSWHMLWVANNNAGGPTYFVDRDIMETAAQE